MFKKITIALLAVMVFAIPMGASAFSDDYIYTGSVNGSGFVTGSVSVSNMPSLPTVGGAHNRWLINQDGNGYIGMTSFYSSSSSLDFASSSVPTNRYILTKRSDGTIYWQSSGTGTLDLPQITYEANQNTLYANFKATSGSTVFFTNVEPPPPPKPVQIQAVKTVEEIVPQTATVAGGIVLAVSILLGVWLLVGLVKRLTYSFLR